MNSHQLITCYDVREANARAVLRRELQFNGQFGCLDCLDAPEWIARGSHKGKDGYWYHATRIIDSLGVWRDYA